MPSKKKYYAVQKEMYEITEKEFAFLRDMDTDERYERGWREAHAPKGKLHIITYTIERR